MTTLRRSAFVVVCACMALFALMVPTPSVADPLVATIQIDPTHTITIAAPAGDVCFGDQWDGPSQLGVAERHYNLSVGSLTEPTATIQVSVRKLLSGSVMVFTRLNSMSSEVSATVALSGSATTAVKHTFDIRPDLRPDPSVGVDRTSGPYGWVALSTDRSLKSTVLLSKSYRYRQLTQTYDNGGSSVVKELVSETATVTLGSARGHATVVTSLSAAGDSCENYLVLAPRSIVDSRTSSADVRKVTEAEWRWVDSNGSYLKSPLSTEPVTDSGYVRALAAMRCDATLKAYQQAGSRFFEDLLLSDLYSLAMNRSSDGLWRTDYTSTWVKGESGIVAPYVDTRHNEAFAMQSLKICDVLEAHGVTSAAPARSWASAYGSFLLDKAARGAVYRTPNGLYFADYYDDTGQMKSHASLNHSLGEMNYLFAMYGETSSTPYLTLAKSIKNAVDFSGTRWVKPNKDLYYEMTLDGNYSGMDYPTVTYYDLLASQRNFTTYLGKPDPIFAQLLDAKRSFLHIRALSAAEPITPPPTPEAPPPGTVDTTAPVHAPAVIPKATVQVPLSSAGGRSPVVLPWAMLVLGLPLYAVMPDLALLSAVATAPSVVGFFWELVWSAR